MYKYSVSNHNVIQIKETSAFVAISNEDTKIQVGFAYRSGNTPTNLIEELAAFVWSECYPRKPFDDFHFYDFQRLGMRAEDGKPIFSIFPVEFDGYASRGGATGLLPDNKSAAHPHENDVLTVKKPVWKSEIKFPDLPSGFRFEVKKNLINPSRVAGLI